MSICGPDGFEDEITKIRGSLAFMTAEKLAHSHGYITSFDYGECNHDGQVDFFVSYEVCDSAGESICTFDDGFLTAYKPLAIKKKPDSWEKRKEGIADFLSDLMNIVDLLKRSSFVVVSQQPMDNPSSRRLVEGEIHLQSKWSKNGVTSAIINIKTPENGIVPSIGDCVIIEHELFQITQIA